MSAVLIQSSVADAAPAERILKNKINGLVRSETEITSPFFNIKNRHINNILYNVSVKMDLL